MTEGLVGGEGFAADASLIQADANRQRGVCGIDAARAHHCAQLSAAFFNTIGA